MSPTPLATQADLEAGLQRALDPAQAAMALRRASARVRKHCRQQFTLVENETVTLPGGGRVLRLPQRPPVIDGAHPLTVVELFGISNVEYTALEGRDFTRIGSELTRVEQSGEPTPELPAPANLRCPRLDRKKKRLNTSHRQKS